MDLDEWELLPDDGYLEINDDNKIYSRNYNSKTTSSSVFHMNYFICPPKSTGPPYHPPPKQLLPVVPIELQVEPTCLNQEPSGLEKIKSVPQQDPVSQVFFKKMKENEFVDMRVESPKSSSSKGGVIPHMDFQFEEEEEKGDHPSCNNKEAADHSEMFLKENNNKMESDHQDEIEDGGGLNIWKWSLTGIGAICSFGVVAATFCIISFTTHRNKHRPHHHNRKLQFQIYTNDHKRMKQVVHHASKINEAISAVRGVPAITRAHITFGGYYDAASAL